jgi:hypothetical protein
MLNAEERARAKAMFAPLVEESEILEAVERVRADRPALEQEMSERRIGPAQFRAIRTLLRIVTPYCIVPRSPREDEFNEAGKPFVYAKRGSPFLLLWPTRARAEEALRAMDEAGVFGEAGASVEPMELLDVMMLSLLNAHNVQAVFLDMQHSASCGTYVMLNPLLWSMQRVYGRLPSQSIDGLFMVGHKHGPSNALTETAAFMLAGRERLYGYAHENGLPADFPGYAGGGIARLWASREDAERGAEAETRDRSTLARVSCASIPKLYERLKRERGEAFVGFMVQGSRPPAFVVPHHVAMAHACEESRDWMEWLTAPE